MGGGGVKSHCVHTVHGPKKGEVKSRLVCEQGGSVKHTMYAGEMCII